MPKKPLDPLRRAETTTGGRALPRVSPEGKTVSITLPAAMIPALAALKDGMMGLNADGQAALDERKLDRLVQLLVTDRELKADQVEQALRDGASSYLGDLLNDPRFLGL